MSHVLFLQFRHLQPVGTAQNPILAQSTNFSTDYVYESIAKKDILRGLLADEHPRETLIDAEHVGSALSDNVVSPVIRSVKSPNLQFYARGFYARVAQPAFGYVVLDLPCTCGTGALAGEML